MYKNFFIVLFGFFLIVFLAAYFFYSKEINIQNLNFVHKYVAEKILNKWEEKLNSLPDNVRAIVDYNLLISELNFYEKDFVEKIFSINPKTLGFKGRFYSKDKPKKLKQIESITLNLNGNPIETGIQYCPEHSYNDFVLMIIKMKNDIGRELFIDSGYRSPGRQAYLFFYYLIRSNEYSLMENAKWIAMPGFSEHGSPINNAIDFVNKYGINGFSEGQTAKDFEELPEYKWLLENANNFNFYLSYPKNNLLGVAFEPWHWHWEGKLEKNNYSIK